MFFNEILCFCMAVFWCLNNLKLLLKLHTVDQIVETVALWVSHEAHQDACSESVTTEIKYSILRLPVTKNKYRPPAQLPCGPRVIVIYNQHLDFVNGMSMGFVFTCIRDEHLEPFSSLGQIQKKTCIPFFTLAFR